MTGKARWRLTRAVARTICLAALASVCATSASAADSEPAEVRFEDFVGAKQCGGCHAEQYQTWRKSTHGQAGGAPGEVPFAGPFSGTVLQFADATVTLEVDKQQRYFYHVDRPGVERRSLEVAGFVGGGHMLGGGTQTSFSQYSDGSWRLLPFDYSKHSDLWFCDTGRRGGWQPITPALSLDSCMFWPPVSNFGINCGNCHSSQMQSRFDTATRREQVRFMSLAINCESCHGPGRRHSQLMQGPDRHSLVDIGMTPLQLLDKQRSVEICFRCHAKTQPLAPGYLPGKPLQEHYALNFYGADSRLLDGRSNGWAYQEGHLFSDCFLSGSMTCVDCHAPHSQGYRDIDGFPLPGKLDDGQCLDCHPAKAQAVSAHTGHPENSPGSSCVACHMPFLQQTAVGGRVQFTRSDHTIPIPRPALDASLGLETACAACHADKSTDWQQAQVDRWHGPIKPHKPIVSTALQLQRNRDPGLARRALEKDFAAHPSAQLDLLRSIGEILPLPNEAPPPGQVNRLRQIAHTGGLDAATLAQSWLAEIDRQAQDRPELSTPARLRVAAWRNKQGVNALLQGNHDAAISRLQDCVRLNPKNLQCHMDLANTFDAAGRPRDTLETLRGALAADMLTRQQYIGILDSICAVLEAQDSRDLPPNSARQRICAEELRRPAVPVSVGRGMTEPPAGGVSEQR